LPRYPKRQQSRRTPKRAADLIQVIFLHSTSLPTGLRVRRWKG
jgi:hypothetical protein